MPLLSSPTGVMAPRRITEYIASPRAVPGIVARVLPTIWPRATTRPAVTHRPARFPAPPMSCLVD
ncbi:MAG: hypothetical protein U0790_08965 [Isosphaeraceae bacterium]